LTNASRPMLVSPGLPAGARAVRRLRKLQGILALCTCSVWVAGPLLVPSKRPAAVILGCVLAVATLSLLLRGWIQEMWCCISVLADRIPDPASLRAPATLKNSGVV